MGRAAVEPHGEDVADHFVIAGIAPGAEEYRGIFRGPDVDALGLDHFDDAAVDVRIDQQLLCLSFDEERDGHAPGALAADHPVGAALDHRSDAVAALVGYEAGIRDGLERELAKRRPPLPARLCLATLSRLRGRGTD